MELPVFDPIRTAERLVDEESRKLVAECDALETFHHEITAFVPDSELETRSPNPKLPLLQTSERRNVHKQIIDAYRETMMEVAHYDEYGNDSLTDIEAEFGPDIAMLLVNDIPLTEQFKRHLLSVIDESLQQRESFLKTLETERQSLERAEDELDAFISSQSAVRDALQSHRPNRDVELFDTVTPELEPILDCRQEHLHAHSSLTWIDGHDLCRYLYSEPEWTYPVLQAAANVGQMLEATAL